MIDITDFLPKYPNINNYPEEILNPYEDNFNMVIYNKKEFYDEKLSKNEMFPKEQGDLMKHQIIISRFFSSRTLYDKLLLVHEMGCLAPETPILLWDGHVKRADEIYIGDNLIGDDGLPRKVLKLIQGEAEMFEVNQNKADNYIVNGEHILTLKISGNLTIGWSEKIQTWRLNWFDKKLLKARCKTISCNFVSKQDGYIKICDFRDQLISDINGSEPSGSENILEIKVKDYIKLSKTVKEYLKGYKCEGVNWDKKPVNLDPYILGMWLGDGNSRGDGFTSDDKELVEYWEKWAEKNNSKIVKAKADYKYRVIRSQQQIDIPSVFKNNLRKYNLINNKHIPKDYLINDRETRLKILAGIIDTDGYVYCNGTCIEIAQKNKRLSDELCYLIRSLGFACSITPRVKYCMYKGEKREGIYQILQISGNNLEDIPTIIPRKQLKVRNQIKNPLITQISISSVGIGNYYGWQLDGNKRFLLGDFTSTHNSGKTCSAIGAVEQIRSENSTFTGAMYFASGQGLLNNFLNELLFKCTKGQYIPENYDELTENQRVRRSKKTTEFYDMNTYQTFATQLSKLSNEQIKEQFSNKILIIDEIHNLRIKDKKKGVDIYREFWRLCHYTENSKILLMSGTPMKDDASEIASVMNLILPLDKQLPTSSSFTKEFFNDRSQLIPNKIPELKESFKGKVSYLKAISTDVSKVFVGRIVSPLKYFIVKEDFMSPFQTEYYTIAYNQEIEKTESSLYYLSRQASLFIYPDGSSGSEGFKKYIKISKNIVTGNSSYYLTEELKKELNGKTIDEKLENLEKFSSKYAFTIRTILKSQKENKCIFVYCKYVSGSGLILLSKILEMYGFTSANGKEKSEGSRYAVITTETETETSSTRIISRFNKPDNMNGKIINVILGSDVIMEGYSLNNIQTEIILTPHWNYSETDQAIARGYRFGSHRALINAGISPVVEIFQTISIPDNTTPSIDLAIYKVAEDKDIDIKQIERIIKESAFDCALNYDRNHIVGYDGQRNCDYNSCDYKCDGIPDIPPKELTYLDYSTYQIYYNSSSINDIIKKTINLYQTRFSIDLFSLYEYFSEYKHFEVLTALRTIINENIIIKNKFGFVSYLKQENNIFFLVDSLSNITDIFSMYYTRNPIISDTIEYNKLVNKMYMNKTIPYIIENIFKKETYEEVKNLLVKLPINIQEILLESSLLSKMNNISKNSFIRDYILEYFEKYIHKIDNVYISSLLFESEDKLKCYDVTSLSWINCDDEYKEIIEDITLKEKENLESNIYGYYGQINPTTESFCIKIVNPVKKEGEFSEKDKVNVIDIINYNIKEIYDDGSFTLKEAGKKKSLKRTIEDLYEKPDEIKIGKTVKLKTERRGIIIKKIDSDTYEVEFKTGSKTKSENIKSEFMEPFIDPRDLSSGRICTTWSVPNLLKLVTQTFKVPIPEDIDKKMKDKIDKFKKLNKDEKILILKDKKLEILNEDTTDDNDLIRYFFWTQQQRTFICDKLKKWFESKGLLVEEKFCGTKSKEEKE